MKIKRYLPRLERMVAADLNLLENKAIFVDDDKYHVFGRYCIEKKQSMYLVTKYHHPVEEFGNLRTALAWCSADKLGKITLSTSITSLERQRQTVAADLVARKHLAQQIKDPFRLEAVQIKIDHRQNKIRYIENQLDKCINLAKYWQIRGFNNETARTGRTASNRANI